MSELSILLGAAAATVLILVGVLAAVWRFYRRVPEGKALVVHTMREEPLVFFTGKMVFPIISRAEILDISVKVFDLVRTGKEALVFKGGGRADARCSFYVRVNRTRDDVLKVAGSVGCERASNTAALHALFEPKFSEALETMASCYTADQFLENRSNFKDELIEVIGRDLNGFILDDVAIHRAAPSELVSGYRGA